MDNIDYETLDDMSNSIPHYHAGEDTKQIEGEYLDVFLQLNEDLEDNDAEINPMRWRIAIAPCLIRKQYYALIAQSKR